LWPGSIPTTFPARVSAGFGCGFRLDFVVVDVVDSVSDAINVVAVVLLVVVIVDAGADVDVTDLEVELAPAVRATPRVPAPVLDDAEPEHATTTTAQATTSSASLCGELRASPLRSDMSEP
jgi:hypothetical protein